jgi:ABC-type nitrate/sulfonate/bicarbonate transport system substrate-binding protein
METKMRQKLAFVVTSILTLVIATACDTGTSGTSTPGPGQSEKVRFAMDWTPNTNHTGIYVAQQKGWYAEEGIELDILPYSDANTPDTLVATGQADFGISFTEAVVTDRINKLPIKSVAAVLQTNTSALATLKSSGLDRPSKLEGKRYAGFGSPYEEPVIRTVLKNDGAPEGTYRAITTNVFGFQSLVAGHTDFVWIFAGWDGIQAKLEGVDLNTFYIKDFNVPDYYTPVIIASESFLNGKGDVARRFLRATARGYEFAVTNPDEAADLLVKGAPSGTAPDAAQARESQKFLVPYLRTGDTAWGRQTLEMWTKYPRFMAETGLLKTSDGVVVTSEQLDYAAMFTNDYLPEP